MSNKNKSETRSKVARALFAHHQSYGDAKNITLEEAQAFLDHALGLLFPQLAKVPAKDQATLESHIDAIYDELIELIGRISAKDMDCAEKCAEVFIAQLPDIQAQIHRDSLALRDGDPAAYSIDEIIIAYPGFYAVAAYRVAHCFYEMNVPLFPRLVSEAAHRVTGVDIHPGASIGDSFFLDHATAVVIGETAVIGDNVKLYQGVTLGALKVDKEEANKKRHPTIEDNVVIYANATILGGQTVIGHDSVIGGNVWLTKSVLPYSRVMYKSQDSSESGLDWTI